MQKFNFIKTLTAGFVLTLAIYPQAWALVQTGTDCDGKCTWTYDSEAEGGPSLVFTANEGASGNLDIKNNYYRFYNVGGQPKNVTIGEGITAIGDGVHAVLNTVSGGKLVVPSTLTEWRDTGSYGMQLSTIEINSTNLSIGEKAIRNASPTGITTIIMPANANITFDEKAIVYSESPFTQTLNIQCKGAKAICDASLAGVKATIESNGGTYQSDYYSETDGNKVTLQYFDDGYRVLNEDGFYNVYNMAGNLKGYSNLNGREIYDESGSLLEKYDLEGNMLTGKQIRADGSVATLKDGKLIGLKKNGPFTPAEAAALVKKGNVNKVTLTFK